MTAFYLRLSSADGDLGDDGKDESNSIENQRAILNEYLKRSEDIHGEVVEYIDDGYSGTNFDRPAFKQMLEDMKAGKIKTVMTKDLSRLGRNYIEVGDYMEQIFPLLGIRYIAVNSNYDSNNYLGKTLGIEMSMMNLVNSIYSKDLSGKVKSAFSTKWKSGRSTSGRPTFGYRLDPEDKTKWIIEPEAAAIVREIFDMALKGMASKEIAIALNQDNVITPGKYREKHGYVKRASRSINDEEWVWDYTMVWKILRTYEYTGALVHGKNARITVGSSHVRRVPDNERFIFENHHEQIVTHGEYEKAQAVIKRQKQSAKTRTDNCSLAGKVYCGNCGLRMTHKGHLNDYFTCSHKVRAGQSSSCSDAKHPNDRLQAVVRKSLCNQLILMRELSDDLKISAAGRMDPVSEIQKIDRDLYKLRREKTRLYEDYADGRLDKRKYLKKKESTKAKIERLEEQKVHIKEVSAERISIFENADHYLDLADSLGIDADLSREAVEAFVERITVYDENHIEIRFSFDDLLGQMLGESPREGIA